MPYDSPEARQLNIDIFETIYHAAVTESVQLAREQGAYAHFADSPAARGHLQFDLWGVTPSDARYDWTALKQQVVAHGMRNSLLVAPMPTATTAQILGNTESFEPFNSNMYVRRTLAGEFQVVNKHLVNELCHRGLWNDRMRQLILAHDGSVQHIPEIPQNVRELFKTVWEIKGKVSLQYAADRGPFICQSQSLNLHMIDAHSSKLTAYHFTAWKMGLKTGMYYLRTKAATDACKFTVDTQYTVRRASDAVAVAVVSAAMRRAVADDARDTNGAARTTGLGSASAGAGAGASAGAGAGASASASASASSGINDGDVCDLDEGCTSCSA